MLFELSIQNFALIKDLKLEFDPSLNVLTGETGAGKSILIDALRAVLGERLQSDSIGSADTPCVIQAAFSVESTQLRSLPVFQEYLEEGDGLLILKREVTREGRGKNYVNRQIVNLSVLKEIGAHLIDFHGQYDQQHIFQPETHLGLVDHLAGLHQGAAGEALKEYRELYAEYTGAQKKKKELMSAGADKQRRMDLLEYQIAEIEKVSPREDEEDALINEKIKLSHAQKLFDLTQEIAGLLEEEDGAATEKAGKAARLMSQWLNIDEKAAPLASELEEAQIRLEEVARSVRDYRDNLSFEEGRLEEIENRISAIEHLKRKYGGDVPSVLAFLETCRREYDELDNTELYAKDLDKAIKKLEPEMKKRTQQITGLRQKAAAKLKKEVEKELIDLGIKSAEFEVRLTESGFGPLGAENVEFYLSPNPGYGLKPLAKVASGGEASRILLALKKALAEVDDTPTLVFDEIDANIGGRLGDVVGKKLKDIAKSRQIMLITHLPQIASFGDRHFRVLKTAHKGKTFVEYTLLDDEEKVRELAQMMSGQKETDISKTHAREMLKTAGK